MALCASLSMRTIPWRCLRGGEPSDEKSPAAFKSTLLCPHPMALGTACRALWSGRVVAPTLKEIWKVVVCDRSYVTRKASKRGTEELK